jgi:hypothetical protein
MCVLSKVNHKIVKMTCCGVKLLLWEAQKLPKKCPECGGSSADHPLVVGYTLKSDKHHYLVLDFGPSRN